MPPLRNLIEPPEPKAQEPNPWHGLVSVQLIVDSMRHSIQMHLPAMTSGLAEAVQRQVEQTCARLPEKLFFLVQKEIDGQVAALIAKTVREAIANSARMQRLVEAQVQQEVEKSIGSRIDALSKSAFEKECATR